MQENVSKSFPVKLSELSLPEDQESKLKQLLTKHAEVFAKSDDDLGYTEKSNTPSGLLTRYPSLSLIGDFHPAKTKR